MGGVEGGIMTIHHKNPSIDPRVQACVYRCSKCKVEMYHTFRIVEFKLQDELVVGRLNLCEGCYKEVYEFAFSG